MTTRRRGGKVAKVLRDIFGVSELRSGQQAVMDALLAKQRRIRDDSSGLSIRSEAVAVGAA
jgi:hypothetical protein